MLVIITDLNTANEYLNTLYPTSLPTFQTEMKVTYYYKY